MLLGMQDIPRFLIVDDDGFVRERLRAVLEDAYPSARFDEASDADEAVRLAGGQPYAVILLDVRMPGRSGIEALPDLKLLQPAAAVVIVTVGERDGYERAALRAGAAAFVAKERADEELVRAVRRVTA
jgi:two-component system invasion response regulator UvrY